MQLLNTCGGDTVDTGLSSNSRWRMDGGDPFIHQLEYWPVVNRVFAAICQRYLIFLLRRTYRVMHGAKLSGGKYLFTYLQEYMCIRGRVVPCVSRNLQTYQYYSSGCPSSVMEASGSFMCWWKCIVHLGTGKSFLWFPPLGLILLYWPTVTCGMWRWHNSGKRSALGSMN